MKMVRATTASLLVGLVCLAARAELTGIGPEHRIAAQQKTKLVALRVVG